MRRFLFSAIGSIAVLMIAMQSSASNYLNQTEMLGSRGGGAMVKDCTYSCNAANQFINVCPKANMRACFVCEKGTDIVHYADQVGQACGKMGGFTSSPTRSQPCGGEQKGMCTAVGACTNLNLTGVPCKNPPTVCPQGNCP